MIKGFFFTTCMNAVMKIAKFAYENDRTFTLNLSALFLTQYYKKEFIAILPYVDISGYFFKKEPIKRKI